MQFAEQSNDPFWHLHDGLTVSMIMTGRNELMTCTRKETVSAEQRTL